MSEQNNTELVIDPQDANENKLMAILCYVIFLVPLILGKHKESPLVKFHLNQSLLIAICAAASIIVAAILLVVFMAIGVAFIGWIIYFAVIIMLVVCEISGIISAAKGTAKKVPLIGGLFTLIK